MDDLIGTYFDAWNEKDAALRNEKLERCLTADSELVDPLGRWRGLAGFSQRISRYHESAPGTLVAVASGVDAHNDVVRYAWRIVDEDGSEIMEGLDVAERTGDGRLRRILMFHGTLPTLEV